MASLRLHAVLLLLAASVAARAANGGSGYSRHGLGDLRYGTSGRGMGMGGVGMAFLSPGVIDPLNPASWGAALRTQFSISGYYEGFSSSDERASAYLADASFSGVMFAVPLIPKWGVVLGAGVTPYSRVNYNVVSPASANGYNYTVQYKGDGGISEAHAGLSAVPDSSLYLGAKMNYYFGTIQNTVNQTFTPAQYTNAEDIRLTRFNGLGASFGMVYTGLGHLFGIPQGHSLNLGFVVSTRSNLTSAQERYFTYTTPTLTTRDTALYPDGTTRLPLSAGGGIAYTGDRYSIGADYYWQNWKEFEVDGVPASDLRDSYRFAVGGEFIPRKEGSAPFFQRLAYRAGFFYDASYYDINGEAINELGFTAGFGIPVVADTRIHIAAGYSFRGTTDLQLEREHILRFTITLSTGELWFIHPPEE
jgi:hypothetical protein